MNSDERNGLGMTTLHTLAREGTPASIAWLLDHGADINALDKQYSTTPLGWAARFGAERLPAIELLLERGAVIDEPVDEPWAQPLAWATRRGHAEVVERLKRERR